MTGRSLSSGDRYPYSSSRSAFSIFRGDLKIVCMLKVEILQKWFENLFEKILFLWSGINLFVCVCPSVHPCLNILAYLSQSLNCMSVSYPISSGICFWHTPCHRNHIFIYSSRIAELIFLKLDQKHP